VSTLHRKATDERHTKFQNATNAHWNDVSEIIKPNCTHSNVYDTEMEKRTPEIRLSYYTKITSNEHQYRNMVNKKDLPICKQRHPISQSEIDYAYHGIKEFLSAYLSHTCLLIHTAGNKTTLQSLLWLLFYNQTTK